MKLLFLFLILSAGYSQAQIVVEKSGTLTADETWYADTVKVTADVIVNNGVTLTINPGVYVEFQGHFQLDINGRILAQGSPDNRIVFTAKNKVLETNSGGWNAIRFNYVSATNDTSVIAYCDLSYGNDFGESLVDNSGAVILCKNTNKVIVSNCSITQNAGKSAIYCYESSAIFVGNVIVDNNCTGFQSWVSSTQLINNTIANNSKSGIVLSSSYPRISNCIVANNGNLNLNTSTDSYELISHSNIQGAELVENGNMDSDPKFLGTGNHPYSLSKDSYCIGAGKNAWITDSVATPKDIVGNARIYKGGTDPYVDMGAYEFIGDPNPFIEVTSINPIYIRPDSFFIQPLIVKSFPKEIVYTLTHKPEGVYIENDSLKWMPGIQQKGTNDSIEIEISNGIFTKTLTVVVNVLNDNEYYELSDEDLVWTADTVKVFNNLTILNGRTLTIEPGVFVEFQENCKLNVKGRILARGTPDKRITFSAADTVLTETSGGWNGIRFYYTSASNDSSIIEFSNFKCGNSANSDWTNSQGTALWIESTHKIRFANNIVSGNRTLSYYYPVIYIRNSSSTLVGNLITDNIGTGIECEYGQVQIINNTIANNKGYGLNIYQSSAQISNCIIAQNGYSNFYDHNATINVFNSNIQNYESSVNGNIDHDPQFVGEGANPYELKGISVCVNSGKSDWTTDSIPITMDINGNPRIYSQGSTPVIDMGAYERQNDPEPYLNVNSVNKKFIRYDSLYVEALELYSYPKTISYTFLKQPEGLFLANDSLFWTPTEAQKGKEFGVELVIDNGMVKDTLAFDIYVLIENEYYELPKSDMVWALDTIKVYNNLTIYDSTTLTINKGVYVEFQGEYSLTVKGRLLAVGTGTERIIFTAKDSVLTDSSGGWSGIRFWNTPRNNDSTIIEFCTLKYGNTNNSGWVDRAGSALFIYYTHKVRIANCLIKSNRTQYAHFGVIYIDDANPTLVGNVIADNLGAGLEIEYSKAKIINNTIVNNSSSGIDLYRSSPEISNCIIAKNAYYNLDLDTYSHPIIQYSNIIDLGLIDNGNMDQDPKFIEIGNHPYALQASSLCLNAGKPSWNTDSLSIATDILGNPRIYSEGAIARADMGAYELQSDPENYLKMVPFNRRYLDSDSLFVEKLSIFSYPQTFSSSLINAPEGLSISSDSLFWTPTKDQRGAYYTTGIAIDNGFLKDTMFVELYVLDTNDFYVLPKADVTWDSDTIKVFNNLTVENNYTLTIKPGTYIEYQGHFDLNIKGCLKACGTPDSIITFAAKDTVFTDTSGGWIGFKFINIAASNDTSVIDYCHIKYANANWGEFSDFTGGAFFIDNINALQIKNSLIENCRSKNAAAMYLDNSSILISGNTIRNVASEYAGIITLSDDASLIVNNSISNSISEENVLTLGIYNSTTSFLGNILYSNTYTGNGWNRYGEINIYNSALTFYNNTFFIDNGYGGINISGNSNIAFVNTAFIHAQASNVDLYSVEQGSQVHFSYCMANDTLLPGTGNIKTELSYKSHGLMPELIQGFSPCINAGDPNFTPESLPGSTDLKGAKRIYNHDNGGIIDIGAYEYQAEPYTFGIDPFVGGKRQAAANFVIDSVVYIGLGKNADSTFSDFWRYTHATNLWTRIADFPGGARSDVSSFVLNGKAYVGLGTSKSPTQYYSDFYEYNPATNQWKKLNDFAGMARYDAVAFVLNDTAYLGTGGNESGELKDFWKYNPTMDEWSEIAAFTGNARRGAVAFAINGKGYVSGGIYVTSYSTQLSDVQEYDPLTNTWKEKIFADGINLSFYGASTIVSETRAYICYGNKNRIVSYTPATNQVESMGDVANLGNDRWGATSFILDDSVYFGLGFYSIGFDSYFMNDLKTIDLPFAPYDILISKDSITENEPHNSLVGILHTRDISLKDSFIYTLVQGEGDTDNDKFALASDSLLSPTCNYEIQNQYYLRIKTTDLTGESYEKNLLIFVKNINDKPSDIILDDSTLIENSMTYEHVGYVIGADEDADDQLSYELVAGEGDTDNNSFYLNGDDLMAISSLNYEHKKTYSIRLKVTDAFMETFEKNVIVYVEDQNEAPINLTLSNADISTADSIGSIIGYFSVDDVDEDEAHVYTIISGTGFDYYSIQDSLLLIKKKTANAPTTHEINVVATDKGGLKTSEYISIFIEEGMGLTEAKNAEGRFQIYPNPVREQVNIKVLDNANQVLQLKLIDNNGKTVLLKTTDIELIDLSDFSKGSYVLLLICQDAVYYHHLIIE